MWPQLLQGVRSCSNVLQRCGLAFRQPAPHVNLGVLSILGSLSHMSLRRSAAVQEWLGKQNPRLFQRWENDEGRSRAPQLSRRQQAHRIKQAVRMGEIALEPTVMTSLPYFKGRKRHKDRIVRQAEIEQKMKEMPKLIADYREARRAYRQKRREDNRFK